MANHVYIFIITFGICLQFFCVSATNAKLMNTTSRNEITGNVLKKWEKFESRIKELVNYVVKLLLPKLMEAQSSFNISQDCTREAMMLIGGLRKLKPWALRILDASAKLSDGIMTGTMSAFGAYDQCLTTFVRDKKSTRNKDKILFQGKYCAVNVKPPLPPKPNFYKLNDVLPELRNFSEKGTAVSEIATYAHFFYFISLRFGLCVPSGCTNEDVQQLADAAADYFYMNATVLRCEIKEEKMFTPVVIAVITVLSFFGFLMLIGSLADIFAYYTKTVFTSIYVRLLLCFSLISNFKKLVNTKTSSDTLSCLNGIRFLSMSWVVLGHTYLLLNFQLFRGLESVREYSEDFAFQAVINGSVVVDTFFSIGGLLVTYVTINVVKGMGKKFNIPFFILHRLWRMYPVYAVVILVMFLEGVMGDGPIWYDTTHHFMEACYKNWWTNLLFINNFYDPQHMCISQSWYMACDMQLYIVSLLVLLPLLRRPKIGLGIAVFGVIASIIYSGVFTYYYDFPPAMLFSHPDPDQRIEYWASFYFKPFIHASPYFIGMITGYLLATRPKMKIPRAILLCGWCMAIISNMSVLYGVWDWNKGRDPTFWETMFYSSLSRTAWSMGVCWMIICCATGHGGVINYILSWKMFVPLGRLTFIVYLVHPLVQVTAVGNVRAQIQPAHFFAVWVYLGHMFVTYSGAFAGSMLVEAPCLALEKVFMSTDTSKVNEGDLSKQKNNLGDVTCFKVDKNGDLTTITETGKNIGEEDNVGFVRL